MFKKIWKGTEPGCVHSDFSACDENGGCANGYGDGWVETMRDYEQDKKTSRIRSGDIKGCSDDIDPNGAVEMSVLNGTVICGRRAGNSFEQAVRPDVKTGLCP